MKSLALIILSIFVLSGCISSASLLSKDGARYPVKVEQAFHKCSTNIDGIEYSGKFVRSMSIGFGSAFGGRSLSTGTGTSIGSNGQALMTAENGSYLECNFNIGGTSVLGHCETNNGREFVLTSE